MNASLVHAQFSELKEREVQDACLYNNESMELHINIVLFLTHYCTHHYAHSTTGTCIGQDVAAASVADRYNTKTRRNKGELSTLPFLLRRRSLLCYEGCKQLVYVQVLVVRGWLLGIGDSGRGVQGGLRSILLVVLRQASYSTSRQMFSHDGDYLCCETCVIATRLLSDLSGSSPGGDTRTGDWLLPADWDTQAGAAADVVGLRKTGTACVVAAAARPASGTCQLRRSETRKSLPQNSSRPRCRRGRHC